ncbi:Hypothetical protein ADU72_0858 [Pediococcus damnosus]|uniref:Phage shock protein PspC N-terminal domain-containing protein n=1 Tax=Pediococcus damnosus TaxID=51663 RepID=A0ABN4NC02_9LACO|nr:Hypothetical protein ADU72_0858 [Pediococcus damnosus]
MNKKLTKSSDKVISGVIGGFAEYLGVDKALFTDNLRGNFNSWIFSMYHFVHCGSKCNARKKQVSEGKANHAKTI